MGDLMDIIGNISDNVCSILGILLRKNLDDDFVFKSHNSRIVPHEEDILRALSEVKANIFPYVYSIYDLGHKYMTIVQNF